MHQIQGFLTNPGSSETVKVKKVLQSSVTIPSSSDEVGMKQLRRIGACNMFCQRSELFRNYFVH